MSAVEIEILGDGAFAGARANIGDYSVTEYAAPLGLNDMQSGVGGLSFDVIEDTGFNGSMLLPRQPFRLSDPYAGSVRGVIDGGVSSDGISLSVSASGSLLPLVSRRTLPALDGTLGAILIRYFQECGMTGVNWQMDSDVTSKHITTPSWNGDVWTQIKKLMAIHQFELADVDGTIVVRKQRLRNVDVSRYTATRLSYGQTDATQSVEVYYYNNEWKVNQQVYPDPESSIVDRSIIQVGASETSVTNVPVNMWISTIDEPEQVVTLPWDGGSNTSVYAVVDKDGVPVRPEDWQNGGGLVSFAIGIDRKSIDITVRGMSTDSRAPYRIASSSEDQEYQYAALYIAATGVAFERKMIWSPTGADLVDAPVDEILTIDDPMVSTIQDAQVILAEAVMTSNGFAQSFEADTTHINRRGETGQFLYPSFAEYDTTLPVDYTFTQWNTDNPLITFEQFTSDQAALVADDFENQAFGGIGGARVRERNSMYRIRTGSARPGSFGWSADHDNLFSDWESQFGTDDTTFGEFDDMWGDKTFEQHARMPLASPYSKWTEKLRNIFTNSSFEAPSSGLIETRRNNARNPRGVSSGNYDEYQPRYSWPRTVVGPTTAPYPGATTSALRLTCNTAGTGAGRGFDIGGNGDIATPGTTGSWLNYPVTPGVPVTVSGWARSNRTVAGSNMTIRTHNGAGAWVGAASSSASITIPGGTWTFFTHTITPAAGATHLVARITLGSVAWAVNDVIDQTAVYIGRPGTYFDGESQRVTDADMTTAWVGTANASASILRGALPAVPANGQLTGNSGSACFLTSGAGVQRGTKALRIIGTGTGNATHYQISDYNLGLFKAGKTYTAIATVTVPSAQTGALSSAARRINAVDSLNSGTQFMSDPAPNAPGTYQLRLTWTVAPTATWAALRLYNGASAGNGDIIWDDVTVVEGAYTGPAFDGASVAANPDTERYRWLGVAENSASVYETRQATLD